MSDHPLCNVVEAVLLAAGRPVTVDQVLELFDEHERPAAEDVLEALAELGSRLEGTGVELHEVASGWRVQVRPQYSATVSRLWQERPSRYSRALLETLALIAYRQPITRGEIEDIRGVTVASTIMRTMQERNWIRVVGHREVPGRPELLGTTREFLDYFGLKSLDDLPTLAELQDLGDIKVQLELPGGSDGEELPALPEPTADSARATAGAIVADETYDDEAATDDELEAGDAELEDEAPTLVALPPGDDQR
ncbi:MAG: SMC-Scp complex subunit ScpB [Steroidobacteraceae bacterium]